MILLTGHRGYVGSLVFKCLPEAQTIQGDVLNSTLPDADIVIHLAAYTSVSESWNRPVDYLDNLRTTAKLVQAYPNAKIILASSCVNVNPESSPYAFSKRVAADYLKTFHKNWVNLIFPNIYGGSPRSMVDIIKNNDEITVYGDGSQIRDYVHVADIVEGILKAQEWPSGEYSLGSGIGTPLIELTKGKKIIFAPARNEQREAIVPNTTPNWAPRVKVKEYLHI